MKPTFQTLPCSPDDPTCHEWALATATRLARRMPLRDRDDAIGAAMLAFLTRILPASRNARSFRNFVTVAIRHALRDYMRRERAQPITQLDDPTRVPSPAQTPDRSSLGSHPALLQLPPHLTTVVFRHYCQDESLADIAADLGVSRMTIHRRLAEAKAILRAHWHPDDGKAG